MESMVTVQPERSLLTKTKAARQQAEALLKGLVEAKSLSERRLADLRLTDHLKHVTGRSSLDNAIASTRRMIDTLDRTMAQFRRDQGQCEVAIVREGLALPARR
jgi:hypothetical protein